VRNSRITAAQTSIVSSEAGRLAERRRVVADNVAAPSDLERLLDRALDLPNAVWRLHAQLAEKPDF
jgi:hypothetical protein